MHTTYKPEVVLPFVHINGTSGSDLYAQRGNASVALKAALDALQGMAPNARDYYPAGPEAFNAAVRQHQRRLRVLNELADEITAEMEHVNEYLEHD